MTRLRGFRATCPIKAQKGSLLLLGAAKQSGLTFRNASSECRRSHVGHTAFTPLGSGIAAEAVGWVIIVLFIRSNDTSHAVGNRSRGLQYDFEEEQKGREDAP